MNIDQTASIVTSMAAAMLLETQTNGAYLPDYKMKTIVAAMPLYPNKEQVELGEKLLRQYYLGYLDVDIDQSGIDGPIYKFNMNKPS